MMSRKWVLTVGCLAGIFLFGTITSCDKKEETVSTDLIIKEYAKGLDLKLVGEMARKAKDAAGFEKSLNTSANKVNNLDLNDDGKVDYIKVTEYGKDNKRGFSLTTELEKGKVQEVATIEFVKNGNAVDMSVNGNSSLYGNNHHYRSHFGIGDMLLMHWMFSSSRNRYSSPYGRGHYPSHFNNKTPRRSNSQYQAFAASKTASSPLRKSTAPSRSSSFKSPNAGKNAVRASVMANPSKSQSSFKSRGGSVPRSSSSSFGRTSSRSSRSGSSFGGGK